MRVFASNFNQNQFLLFISRINMNFKAVLSYSDMIKTKILLTISTAFSQCLPIDFTTGGGL